MSGPVAGDDASGPIEEHDRSLVIKNLVAIVWAKHNPDVFVPTVRSIAAAVPGIEILIGGFSDQAALDKMAHALVGVNLFSTAKGTLAEAVRRSSHEFTRHVLIVSAPVILPQQGIDRVVRALNDDLRLASVSFLSNAAGTFSVPYRNTPVVHQVGIHDEISITRLLRSMPPSPPMVPVAAPTGAVVALSHYALGAIGGIDTTAVDHAEFLVADSALRAAQRGFINVLDLGTYVTRAYDLDNYRPHPIDDPSSAEWNQLVQRHPIWVDRYHRDASDENSTLARGLATAASKIRGLRIIIDARDLGPKEMGTQVQILSLVRELAARSDVASVQVGIPGTLPAYARAYIHSEKVTVFTSPTGDLLEAEPADVIHRPSQPSGTLPFEIWRSKASRVIVTLQDLIAFQVGSYHTNAEYWQQYRDHLIDGTIGADLVVAISNETVRQIEIEQLPIDASRLVIVPNGTDHLTGCEPEEFPSELGIRGFADQEYLLVLGTNYSHKNRDLAIGAWRTLRSAYPNLALVLAGAFVPTGSSRLTETLASGSESTGLFVLPDVTSAERNWLMRHARVVLYPTSVEGFGLVPFEAARFGTPTVSIRFAPLTEFNNPPVWATGWTTMEISTAVGRLLESPAMSEAQVQATLQSGSSLRWSDTAAGLVHAYRSALSAPVRRTTRG